MKIYIFSIFTCLSFLFSFGQQKIIRSSASNTVFDERSGALKNFILPIYDDTVQANVAFSLGLDSTGAIIFTRDVMSQWIRVCCPKRWVQVASGGAVPIQFNPIAGSNISITGTYPNITFNATVSDAAVGTMADLRSIQGGAGSPLSKIVGSDNQVLTMLGKYVAGDNGVAQYYWSPASSATDDSLAVVKPTATSGAGRWLIVTSSRISSAQAGIKVDGTDQRLTLQAAVNNPLVKELIFESGTVTIAGKVTVPAGKILTFRNNSLIKGDGGTADTLTGGLVQADYRKHVFDTTLTVLNLENNIRSVMWFGGKSDASTAINGTDNLLPAQKTVSSGVAGKVYFPGSTSLTLWYRFSAPWTVTSRIEIYGDGLSSVSSLLFPGTGEGVRLSSTSGASHIHDLRIRGNAAAIASAYNSSTAHGLVIASNACIAERMMVINFDGDGIHVDGTGNANAFKILNCKTEGNGRDGVHIMGTDGNAGETFGLITKFNGRWGYYDGSFLGNNMYGGQVADNAYGFIGQMTVIKYRAAVSHGGNRYRIKNTSAGNTNKEPGVAADWATYWELIGAGGLDATYQAWSAVRAYEGAAYYYARADHSGIEPTITSGWESYWELNSLTTSNANEWFFDTNYLEGGGVCVDNNNSRAQFYGIYKEVSQPTILNRSASAMVFGGWLAAGANNSFSANNTGIIVSSPFNVRAINIGERNLVLNRNDTETDDFIYMEDEGGVDGNINGYIKISGLSAQGFLPGIKFRPEATTATNSAVLMSEIGDGVGANAAFRFSARTSAGGGIVTNKLFAFENLNTDVLSIAATGQLTASFYGASGTKLIQTSNTGVFSTSSIDPANIVTTSVLADSIDNRIINVVRHASTDSVFIKNYNGSETFAFLVSGVGSGITSLNGLVDATQLFAIGTTGADPNFVSATGTHTLHIPLMTGSGVNSGLLSNTTQSLPGVKTFNDAVTISGVGTFTGLIRTNSSTDNANAVIAGSLSPATTTSSSVLVEGATGTGYRVKLYGSNATVQTADYNYGTLIVGNSQITEAASGNANLISSIIVKAPTITGGAATATNTATVYIEGAATATVSGGNYPLWVASGFPYIGKTGSATGGIIFGGITSGAITVKASDIAGAITLTLPSAIVTNGYLKTDASGNLSFEIPSGAGTVTSVAAGLGMNFTTITSTGSVILDTTYAVTKSTQQVIAGQKNFTAGLQTLNIGIGTTQSSQFAANIGGSGYTLALLNASGSVTAQVGSDAYVAFIAGTLVENSSGTHSGLYGVALSAPIITAGAATVTNAATLYIGSAPSGTFTNPATGIRVVGGIRYDGSTSGYATINATPISGSTTLTLPAVTGTLVQYSEASITSSSTPSPTGNARQNYLYVTALAANATFAAPSGTVANGNHLIIRIVDNGTARTLSFNGIYRDGTSITLPTTTVINETMYLHFMYNSTALAWDFLGFTPTIIWVLPFFFIRRPRKRNEYRRVA